MNRKAPKFLQWFFNPAASIRNPHRFGMYVETIRRTGFVNRGTFYRLTDGKGDFWMIEGKNLIPVDGKEVMPNEVAHTAPRPRVDE